MDRTSFVPWVPMMIAVVVVIREICYWNTLRLKTPIKDCLNAVASRDVADDIPQFITMMHTSHGGHLDRINSSHQSKIVSDLLTKQSVFFCKIVLHNYWFAIDISTF